MPKKSNENVDRRFYGEFICPKCLNIWTSGYCWEGFTQYCILCVTVAVTPRFLKDITISERTYYAIFTCKCGEFWDKNLKYKDENYCEKCKTCFEYVYAEYEYEKPYHKKHKKNYCEKCKSLGKSCTSMVQGKRRYGH